MLILGIESTCDETAAAVVADGRTVRSNVVASQVDLHAVFRGVVPEVASRAHVEQILPVIRQALADAETRLDEIDAVAVAYRPGLIGSLLIGVTAAKTLAWSLGKPLVGVDHVHAHLYSVMLESEAGGADPEFPAVGLVCSGGHTALYRLDDWQDVTRIGGTIDDAVGEAYDKVAAILGLPYPGGPVIDCLAADGSPRAIAFPRTLLERDSLDFSFSGLKTAVLYHVRGVPRRGENVKSPSRPAPTGAQLADIAASFQAACVDVLIEKLSRAARQINARSLILGGGVSANRGLRNALAKQQLPIYLPLLRYCTDNAAMSAGLGHLLLAAGKTADLNLDAMTSSAFAV
ncbi:MAG TPA: tRNA (adenosine(37)-N6)-threonylcarbamoyltransferase complex transferase subunit TsaD [Tepidisphaeraceae bacterium]|jgi:N6-L-threonylcarbamoyladenine synthase|nr:tRNA (adenosine(37)-N6)-threonylcarbamoyltransferase complex transferase subunit TsaD [Tepidisphaeraceae bacterium]